MDFLVFFVLLAHCLETSLGGVVATVVVVVGGGEIRLAGA